MEVVPERICLGPTEVASVSLENWAERPGRRVPPYLEKPALELFGESQAAVRLSIFDLEALKFQLLAQARHEI